MYLNDKITKKRVQRGVRQLQVRTKKVRTMERTIDDRTKKSTNNHVQQSIIVQ
jgi:hypothetical protein